MLPMIFHMRVPLACAACKFYSHSVIMHMEPEIDPSLPNPQFVCIRKLRDRVRIFWLFKVSPPPISHLSILSITVPTPNLVISNRSFSHIAPALWNTRRILSVQYSVLQQSLHCQFPAFILSISHAQILSRFSFFSSIVSTTWTNLWFRP